MTMGDPSFWARFVLAVLRSIWRFWPICSLSEDGPGAIIAGLRAARPSSWAGLAMDCFACMSLWVAAPLALFVGGDAAQLGVIWLALSGGALILERLVAAKASEPLILERLIETADPEMEHGMLQPPARGPGRRAHDA